MNKQELIDEIVGRKGSPVESKAAAERAINAVLEGIETGIKKDGLVQLVGFGTFKVKSRPARKGRNPSTGQEIKIKASKSVAFKCGAQLKDVAKKHKG